MAKNDAVVELFYSSTWNDITSDCYTRDAIDITRGRPDEVQRIPPSTMSLTIDNRDGTYSPRNPTSALYGLIGRNTPIRASVRRITDTFTRTESNSWGSTDTGQAWSNFWVSGSANDFDVAAGVGTHVVDGTNEHRSSWLSTESFRDVELAVTVSFSAPNVSGGSVEPGNLLLRMQSVNVYYMARVVVTTAEAVQIKLMYEDTGVTTELATATVSGLTYSGQSLRVRAQIEGQVLRAKVWDASSGEPFDWQVTVTDDTITDPGGVGVRNGVATGNTNVPITFSMDNFEVRLPRFYGEVESWPQRWSVEGNDVWTPITANGIMRRLNAPGTTQPALSSLRRALTVGVMSAGLMTYWPLDDGPDAGALTTPLSDATTNPVAIVRVAQGPELAGIPTIVGFTPNTSTVTSEDVLLPVETHTATGEYVFTWWHQFLPDLVGNGAPYPNLQDQINDTEVDPSTPADSLPSGNVRHRFEFTDVRIDVQHLMADESDAEDEINIFVVTWAGSSAQIRWSLDHELASGWHEIQLRLDQNGSNVDAQLYFDGSLIQGQDFVAGIPQALENTPSALSRTLGTLQRMRIGVLGSWGDPLVPAPTNNWMPYAMGHLSVHTSLSIGQGWNAGQGDPGETAADRIERLATEDGISISIIGDSSESVPVGRQLVKPTLELLHEAAEADGGILYESRGTFGLAYRTHNSLYNQDPIVTLDYAAGDEVAPPLEPVEDTDATVNDVTVTRADGASARVTQDTGPLNVQEPSEDDDGIGRYHKDVTLVLYEDTQCLQQAAWRKHLGTWDEPRYPVVNMDLTAMDGNDALIHAAASLNVGDRFTIENPPSWLPPGDIAQHAQGFSEVLESHHWLIGANATPAGPWDVGILNDTTQGRLDTSDCVLNEALDTTETGVDVISTAVRWVDSTNYASQFPFDVVVSGEQMTVTACSGTGLTQTFTVTRSVNGVVKSHSSGTAVRLYQPLRLAR